MKQLSRRQFIRNAAATVGVGVGASRLGQLAQASAEPMLENDQSSESDAPTLLCPPVMRGHLRPYNHQFAMQEGIEGWRREMDDERRIGSNLLWLSHVRPALDETEADTLQDVFDVCEERNMGIIIETGHTPNWYGHRDLDREINEVREVCTMLAERYGEHPAFYAWYLHHEIYVAYDDFGAYIDELFPAMVEECNKALPDKPVTLSPFFILDRDQVFGDFRYAEPEEYQEYWTQLIRRSGLDIIMLQDSGEHFSYVTMEQRRPFFEAMQAACKESGATFWGNVETAEMVIESIDAYKERYGRVHHSTVTDLPWRNVPIDRLEQKLRLAAEYAENIVSWGYYQFGRPSLDPEEHTWAGRPVVGPIGKEWYEQYREYYDNVMADSKWAEA